MICGAITRTLRLRLQQTRNFARRDAAAAHHDDPAALQLREDGKEAHDFSGVLALHAMWHGPERKIAIDGADEFARKQGSQLVITVAIEKLAQILVAFAQRVEILRAGVRWHREPRWPRSGIRPAARWKQTVPRFRRRRSSRRRPCVPSCLIFLPSMPMSAIQCWPQLLGQPVMCSLSCSSKAGRRSSNSLVSQRAKLLVSVSASLQNSEPVQEIVPRAKTEAFTGKPAAVSSAATSDALFFANIDDQQILHHGVAHVAVGVAIGEVGGEVQLLRRDASAQDRCAHVHQAGLFLVVHADMVAVNVGGNVFAFAGVKRKTDALLKIGEKRFRGPAMLEKEKFQARAFAALAQHVRWREKFPRRREPPEPPVLA